MGIPFTRRGVDEVVAETSRTGTTCVSSRFPDGAFRDGAVRDQLHRLAKSVGTSGVGFGGT